MIRRNHLGMAFVHIPAGEFQMGVSEATTSAAGLPAHRVHISRPFLIGRTVVTQQQWQQLMGQSSFRRPRSDEFYDEIPGLCERISHPDHPAIVSWRDAQDFVRMLSEKEPGSRYRLPSEAEWEYAARAGSESDYCFGNDLQELGDYAWFDENYASGTHPVGQKKPNQWGLYDVHGNVWEWVQDWYGEQPSAVSAVTDPAGPESGSERVVKGGCWHSSSGVWNSACRKGYRADWRSIFAGFRVLLEIS